MNVCYRVELNEAERGELRELLSGGKQPVRKVEGEYVARMEDVLGKPGNAGCPASSAPAESP